MRRLYFAMAGVGALVVLILGVAVVSTYVIRPNASVGQVGNQTITRSEYNKYRSWQIYNQLRILDYYIQTGAATGGTTSTSQYQTQIDQLQPELQQIDTWATLDPSTLSQLADNILMEQKASDVGVSITDTAVLSAAQNNFIPQPTPVPGPTNTPGPPTATATATPTGIVPIGHADPYRDDDADGYAADRDADGHVDADRYADAGPQPDRDGHADGHRNAVAGAWCPADGRSDL